MGIQSQKKTKHFDNLDVQYTYESDGRYRIDNYDQAHAFSSFLPGIAGPDGVPLWCMYVNRGQSIVSFGVANKDNAIMEFLPANWAYQLVGIQGFRTFCKINNTYYEPFQNSTTTASNSFKRTMWIQPDTIQISEINHTLGITFDIQYFSPMNQPIASLVRFVTISNDSMNSISLNILDGLPIILPSGFSDSGIKSMRRILEAYALVELTPTQTAYYRSRVNTHDEDEVQSLEQGNFYSSWRVEGTRLESVEPFVDPNLIFGESNDLITPRNFINQQHLDRGAQIWENRLPCAFTPVDVTLAPGQSISYVSLIGNASDSDAADRFVSQFTHHEDFKKVLAQSSKLIDQITSPAFMVSNVPHLDAYARQNYLDNVVRGGIPTLLPSQSGPTLHHLYTRRHGDLERDYNFFELEPYPLSSGSGNYRDICQNRRHDIWFYPYLLDQEIRFFLQMIQADGFNPLSIDGYLWTLPNDVDPLIFCPDADENAQTEFISIVNNAFHPGQLLKWNHQYNVNSDDKQKWLENVLVKCNRELVASGCEGGYWIDHWTYIIDLLEAFDGIYPDKTFDLLTEDADITWFPMDARVVSRREKYLNRNNGPMQLNAIRHTERLKVTLPPVTILSKLSALLAIKVVSLDYYGQGLEMEAGRPGWNDSLNGLPGLFGSSTCETIEMARLTRWLIDHIKLDSPDMVIPVEVAAFLHEVIDDLSEVEYDWNRSATIREKYRENIYDHASGKTQVISGTKIVNLLHGIEKRAKKGITGSVDPSTGLMHTYYQYKPDDFNSQKLLKDICPPNSQVAATSLEIKSFKQVTMPLFLEGQVHWLRLLNNKELAKKIYHTVRNSPIYDKLLGMYKLNESLGECPPAIGRARIFSRGWFENESIWLHMSYKYLLELLRCGLIEEFYTDAETMLVPFMDPKIYGRSILENSSFIASSPFLDPHSRGRGFVARLSGSTAEFINIWLMMTVAQKPFYMQDNNLCFKLEPLLPGKWFTQEAKMIYWQGKQIAIPANTFACALLGDLLLIYRNKSRNNTYGKSAVKPVRYLLDNQSDISSDHISGELAENVRLRKISRIDVWLE